MTRIDAETLAVEVHSATGHDARVEFEDEDCRFVVLVSIAHPRSGAVHEEFRLGDEMDWDWLRDRIAGA